jgi:DNA-binding NarL/FixJ family response regulator
MKVLVVDKQPVMRLGIAALLRPENDIRPIGSAASLHEALGVMATEQPDIVVLDFMLKGQQSGTELCRQIKSRPDPPGVVVYTANHTEQQLFLCRLSGADSYVHKDEEPERLIEAIRATHAGKRVWFIGGAEASNHNKSAVCEQASLTPREQQIFTLMLKRHTNSDIAEALGISVQTVKNHTSRILRKLHLRRRTDLPRELS